MGAYRIERMEPHAWERVRAIRIRALADTPDAFGTTLAEDESRPLGYWRTRLENPDSATFLARETGHDVGIVVGSSWVGRADTAGLFAMWVAPQARGTGVGGGLVDAVIGWARERDFNRLILDVADSNRAAIALYESRGFLPTGVQGTLPPPREHVAEHQRCFEL